MGFELLPIGYPMGWIALPYLLVGYPSCVLLRMACLVLSRGRLPPRLSSLTVSRGK